MIFYVQVQGFHEYFELHRWENGSARQISPWTVPINQRR